MERDDLLPKQRLPMAAEGIATAQPERRAAAVQHCNNRITAAI
ncbi:hypothetical protein [Xanthomonas bonasiae]|jgi:hypothetical protein|nr:hypothetical protein [Xanthomonas surreyensis]